MEIKYKNKNLQKTCTNASAADKKHGTELAYKIKQRINEISAAESVEQMIRFRIGRCHQLKGDRKNQYAVDLVQPHRLVPRHHDRTHGAGLAAAAVFW